MKRLWDKPLACEPAYHSLFSATTDRFKCPPTASFSSATMVATYVTVPRPRSQSAPTMNRKWSLFPCRDPKDPMAQSLSSPMPRTERSSTENAGGMSCVRSPSSPARALCVPPCGHHRRHRPRSGSGAGNPRSERLPRHSLRRAAGGRASLCPPAAHPGWTETLQATEFGPQCLNSPMERSSVRRTA